MWLLMAGRVYHRDTEAQRKAEAKAEAFEPRRKAEVMKNTENVRSKLTGMKGIKRIKAKEEAKPLDSR